MTFDEYFRGVLRDELEGRINLGDRLQQAKLSEMIGKSASWVGQYLSKNVVRIDAQDFLNVCKAVGISPSLVIYKYETGDGKRGRPKSEKVATEGR